jgi:enoyl-CoA hydratase/carnithine racemase
MLAFRAIQQSKRRFTAAFATIRSESLGAVGKLLISNADKHNAMTLGMYEKLPEAVAELAGTRVVILSGEGTKAFGAGSDISEFKEKRMGAKAAGEYSTVERNATDALLAISSPVIAAIHGPCMGGGLNLALAADVRYCADDAKFAVPPGKLGIGYPLELMELLVRTVGRSTAKELVFTAKVINAEEALRIGLVNAVVPKADLDDYVHAVANDMAKLAPLTLRAAKLACDQLDGAGQACEECYESHDYIEGIEAFMGRRAPEFEGR